MLPGTAVLRAPNFHGRDTRFSCPFDLVVERDAFAVDEQDAFRRLHAHWERVLRLHLRSLENGLGWWRLRGGRGGRRAGLPGCGWGRSRPDGREWVGRRRRWWDGPLNRDRGRGR